MTRLSGKIVRERDLSSLRGLDVDFDKSEFGGAIKTKGLFAIMEKAYLCPCKSTDSPDHLSTCKNCGGCGWIFANPIKTKMIIQSIVSDDKYKQGAFQQWGMLDTGSVKITAYPEDKLSFMDRITVLDATSEHQQILYPALTDGSDMSNSDSADDGQLFAATKYDIKSIDFIGLFEDESTKIKRLIEIIDYTFSDNIIIFNSTYNSLSNPQVTIRYKHNPTFHVVDIPRESMQSYADQGSKRIILPNLAIGKRAHLIQDVENFDGNRLLDNSWLPSVCEEPEVTAFVRQLKYASAQTIFDNLSQSQIDALDVLIHQS